MTSPKVLFFNVPGHGHVNPSLPLVSELARRGHRITYFISEGYRGKVEAAGANVRLYRAVKDDYFVPLTQNGFHPQITACELLKTTEEILPELLEFARTAQPDYVLFDCMCPWGYWVARVLKVPAVSSVSLMPPIVRAFFNKTTIRFMLPMLFRDFGKGIEANWRSRALGAKYGVPPLGQTSLLTAQGDISISYSSAEFVPYSSQAPPSFRFVGRVIEGEPDVDPALFEQVGDRPLVYISMGTVNNRDRDVVAKFIGAFSGRDEFAMISTGGGVSPDSFGKLPENISVHPWLPQIAVIKRASLFISHGGLNSVHDGLYFGVPLLLVPQQEEQALNASRAVELGAGLMLRPGQVQVESIRWLADRLLSEPAFRENARRIGETFRTAGGMSKAADEIEALIGRDRR